MKAQLLTATLLTSFSGILFAADPLLVNLLPPDAKVVAGVNVEQAKGTQFGQWVLTQVQTADAHLQEFIALTGFDPRRDIHELLVSSDGNPQNHTGLALARGNFDVTKITGAATQHGAVTEVYGNLTIIEDPKQEGGVAFLSSTMLAAGDIASVKGAIDRQTTAQPLPAAVINKISQWGNSHDGWAITTVPPASLVPQGAVKGTQQTMPLLNLAQAVQSAGGGVKFGKNVVFSGEAIADTPQNASTMADLVRLMLNLAQMQIGTNNPDAAALLKNATVTSTGTTVTVSASIPQDTFIQMVQPKSTTAPHLRAR